MVDYERLDRALEARRLDLGLSWVQLAAAAGVSDVSLRNFRKGRGTPNALNKRRLEQALQWGPGSWDAVVVGGEPTEASAAAAPAISQQLLELQAERDQLENGLAELDAMGARRTAAYKILAEKLADVEARLRQVDRRTHSLDETGT